MNSDSPHTARGDFFCYNSRNPPKNINVSNVVKKSTTGGAFSGPSPAEIAGVYVETVPGELRERKQFGLRCGKIPYVKNNGWWTRDGWNSPQHWLTFDEVIGALQKGEVYSADGITFFLKRAGDGEKQILALDFDCCVDPGSGDIIPWARGLIERLKPFYAEVSISGTGIRAFVFGNLPTTKSQIAVEGPLDELSDDLKERIRAAKIVVGKGGPVALENIRPRLEIFASNKHATLSGQRLSEFCYPAEDRSQALREILVGIEHEDRARQIAEAIERHAHDRGWLSEKAPIRIGDVINLSDFERVGDQLAGAHPVHGSTTNRNLVIDPQRGLWHCFRHGSGGDAWLLLAVVEGIIDCKDVRHGALRGETLEVVVDAAFRRGLITEDQHAALKETLGEPSDKIQFMDLVSVKGQRRLVDPITGEPTGVWVPDYYLDVDKASKTILKKLKIAISESDTAKEPAIYIFDGQIWRPDGERQIIKILNDVAGNFSVERSRKEVLVRIRTNAPRVQFNPYPYLYPVKNGVLDLAKGEFRDYREEDYLTFQVPLEFTPDADFRPFLWHLCSTLPDMGDVFTAIDLVVSTLIRYPFEVFALLMGPGGNGKSVYERVIQALLPRERVTAVSFDEIKGSRFGPGHLLNKDLWLVSEVTHAKDVINLAKRVATGDYIDSDVKYGGRAAGNPHALLMMDANNAIEFGDSSRGVMRRLVKLDFPYTFGYGPKDRPKDPRWGEFLTRPEHLAGVLWLALLRGPSLWKTKEIYRRKGEDQTREEHARQRYHLEYFCNDCLSTYPPEFGQATSVTVDQAYNEYLEYCRLFNVPVPANQIRFGRYIKDRFGIVSSVTKIDGKSQRVYPGLYLVTTAKTAHAEFLVNFSAPSTDSGYRFYRSVTDWLQIEASTDSEVTDSTDFLAIEEIKRMVGYIEERARGGNFADIKFDAFVKKSVESVTIDSGRPHGGEKSVTESVTTDSGRPCDNLAICNQSVTDNRRQCDGNDGNTISPESSSKEEKHRGDGGAKGGEVENGGENAVIGVMASCDGDACRKSHDGKVHHDVMDEKCRHCVDELREKIRKDLERGSRLKDLFTISTNVGGIASEVLRCLEELEAEGVVERVPDAFGNARWRLKV